MDGNNRGDQHRLMGAYFSNFSHVKMAQKDFIRDVLFIFSSGFLLGIYYLMNLGEEVNVGR